MTGLVRNSSGAALVEFALLAPIATGVILSVFEFVRILLVGSLLEAAVMEASRRGSSGIVTAQTYGEEHIREIIDRHTHGLIRMPDLELTSRVYPSFDAIGTAEPLDDTNGNGVHDPGEQYQDVNVNGQWDEDMGAAGFGGPGDVVLYRTEYELPLLTPFIEPIFGTVALSSVAAVRNEPF